MQRAAASALAADYQVVGPRPCDYSGHMKTTAVANLKAKLSRYLRLVKTGEEILITERDVPVAKIVPVAELGTDLESLRDLERQGLVRLGSGRLPKDFWKLPRGKDARSAASRAVRQERDRGW